MSDVFPQPRPYVAGVDQRGKVVQEFTRQAFGGLSKRELYAAFALQAMIREEIDPRQDCFNARTEAAVQYADALIAELAKPQEARS
jgi:hypothetical protein